MSTTVARALSLLGHFSPSVPELGLSELAERAGVDKATVHRLLATLAQAGFVEQDAGTRRYRLGAEPLRLARVREAGRPVRALVVPALAGLTDATGETAHAALLGGTTLGTIGVSASTKASRVFLDDGEPLPLHGTASGLAVLAFADDAFVDRVLAGSLPGHTAHTTTDPRALATQLDVVRRRGYAEGDQTYQDEVHGIAAPLFDAPGQVCGSIAVATPTYRMTRTLHATIVRAVRAAAVDVSTGLGGTVPASVRRGLPRAA